MTEIFDGGGAAGATMRATDWSRTALGPPDAWPLSLVAHVRAMLHTRQPICIFWGPDLVNLYNEGFLPILGEKHPVAMGQSARECWADAWPVIGAQIESVMRGESVFYEEMLVPITRGGVLEDAWWNYSYSPLYGDDGAVGGVLVICTEITREVTARRELEAANRAKDEFLATISHELRTPLTAMLGWARVLGEGADPALVKKGLSVIERNASAQAKLIDDILDVARIVSGKLELSTSRVDTASVIQAAVESVRPSASAKGIALVVEAASSPPIDADEARLQQIVWNLLANAVKFTPSGGEVRLRAFHDDDRFHLVVSDTGCGISPAFLPHVFDRFRQDDSSTTKQHAGLGLGLAIVRHLVALHEGTIQARSLGPGCGATFEVVLPLRASAAGSADAARSSPSLGVEPTRARLKGATILVVEDERDSRELLSLVLEGAGAKVIEAASAEQALAVLDTAAVVAIVSDVGMPGEDGYRFIERVRRGTRNQHVPALALTAFARAEDRDRALAAGFQDHVAKPIDPMRLLASVAALVG